MRRRVMLTAAYLVHIVVQYKEKTDIYMWAVR